jgi:ankyrin repeat protein
MSELLKQLTSAARDGKVEVVRRILVSNRDYIEKKNEFGNTALHLAATFGKQDCVELLIKKGADILGTIYLSLS